MSEDRFYSKMRSVITEYRPEVPASVYEGMRKKLWWSNFTRLSITRFNMWYVLLIIGGIGTWAGVGLSKQEVATQVVESTIESGSQEISVSAPQLTMEDPEKMEQVTSTPKVNRGKDNGIGRKDLPANRELLSEKPDAEKAVSPVTEKQSEPAAPAAETQQTEPVKQGNRKGLKITTYGTDEKKK